MNLIPRVSLAHLPTPLDPCERLGAEIGGPRLWIKRDDATGLALGGNKVRQLEFILGHVVAEGYDCVIQGAASQSNHARQLAAAGAKLGLEIHLTPWQDHRSDPIQGNYLLSHLFGARLHPISKDSSIIEAKRDLAEKLRSQGRKPFIVGMGAPEALVLAAIAYVATFIEIIEQLGENGPPDYIFTASQGSTQAGLLAAAKILGLHTRVIGINPMGPSHEAYNSPATIHRMALDVITRLGSSVEVPLKDVINRTDFVGDEYGVPSVEGLAALRRLARTEGILLDPVYSSKGFAGLLDAIDSGEVNSEDRAVFVHTGGLPGIFAYSTELLA